MNWAPLPTDNILHNPHVRLVVVGMERPESVPLPPNSKTGSSPRRRRQRPENLPPIAGAGTLLRPTRDLFLLYPAMSSQGIGSFSGFTRLCKGISAVLIAGYGLLQIVPSANTYLALIPAKTIPFAWNLITAGYVEPSLSEVVVSVIGLLVIGRLLEPIWGSKEFFKFILVVNFLTSVCIFITAIALYYITWQESFLYTPLSGFHGVLSGLLVGIKQIIPEQELGLLSIKAKWVPSLFVLISIILSFFALEPTSYLPTIIFGAYMSWIYLRYFQRKAEMNFKGDPSDEFSFSSFFPPFMWPILDPIASVFDRMLCGRFRNANEEKGQVLGGNPLPGSDPIDASRRRERGARALEERLAAEKQSATGSSQEDPSHSDPAENV